MTAERIKIAKDLANDEPDQALVICNDILNEYFEGDIAQQALFISAYVMMQAERYGLAYNIYRRCAQMNPDISETYNNMGMCLEDSDYKKAKKLFRKAYRLKPNAHALANEGLMCLMSGEPQQCIDLNQKALLLDPSLRAAKHNTGLAQLMLRQFKDGWANYHATIGVKHREGRDYGLPEWEGQSGKVVVYGEQGVGDEIMFASCLADLAKTNDVVLDCDARLERLFKRSFDFPVFGTRFKTESPLMDSDAPEYQIAIGQLPHFFRNCEEDYTGTPYLTADPERRTQWRALFDTFKGRKIGIAWRGGMKSTGEAKRSLDLADLEPLLNDSDTFISLEYKPVDASDLDRYGIKSYPETAAGGDIDLLAGLVSELDMVVTSCTTVVYVAGALGVPCHVLVPEHPGYRYHLEGNFPWYSSVKLHRQQGTWRQTVDKLCNRIRPSRDSGLPRSLSQHNGAFKRAGTFHTDQQAQHI